MPPRYSDLCKRLSGEKDLEDKEVCLLGTYDNETGQIISFEPEPVYNLEKEVKA